MTTRKAVSARSSSSHRMPEADVVHARAAPALPDRRAQEAQLAHPVEDLAMHLALSRPTRGCAARSRAATKSRTLSWTSRFSGVSERSMGIGRPCGRAILACRPVRMRRSRHRRCRSKPRRGRAWQRRPPYAACRQRSAAGGCRTAREEGGSRAGVRRCRASEWGLSGCGARNAITSSRRKRRSPRLQTR